MMMRVAGVKSVLHPVAGHDFASRTESDLLLVEDERMSEDLGNTFELVVRRDDQVTGF